ncbi:TetR/AcrR family transcriptional regulator [Streptomyces sp. LP05-1]|uniref:TetR/AcrR family transcriptional regulator n=1 Tax=Streptomyces pyxinae TaxID=2970734 RepID=A0ABT2CBH0_9ACTN|nr:TetR/AcrR family transcriptional regulator [Streptomyces sp. LP05-1]MCS0634766.1 TetR/AcrR family transcriptional regulator [Streptomyces sp. LP05-1]
MSGSRTEEAAGARRAGSHRAGAEGTDRRGPDAAGAPPAEAGSGGTDGTTPAASAGEKASGPRAGRRRPDTKHPAAGDSGAAGCPGPEQPGPGCAESGPAGPAGPGGHHDGPDGCPPGHPGDARRAGPGKRSAAGTRSALLGAASLRFGQFGYDGTGIRDIARDAGVDAALVYRYFGSKEALFAAVSRDTAIFDPLLETPLDEVAAWISDFVTSGAPNEEIPHPVLAVLRSPGRSEEACRFRNELAGVFSERFAQRLDGPDPELRAELLAAWLLGISLMRKVIQLPALSTAPEDTLHRQLHAALTALLGPGSHPGCPSCPDSCPCGRPPGD